ncbi:hypothetical protein OQA88_5204 [Cercophora sp. LCS_1]
MTTINVFNEAGQALALIVNAKGIMRNWIAVDAKQSPSGAASFGTTVNGFISRLDSVWAYVADIQKKTDEHTPAVGAALVVLKGTANKLNGTWPAQFTLVDVGNVVWELEQARDAVRRARPGDLHHSQGNKAEGGEVQLNGALAATQDRTRRLVVEAVSNQTNGSPQINAPVFGTATDVQKMLLALKGVKA